MDWDACNHKKLNQFHKEAQRWKSDETLPKPNAAKRKKRTQVSKRAKKRK
jgi:hypothetical protein